jgi:hypothetical protein
LPFLHAAGGHSDALLLDIILFGSKRPIHPNGVANVRFFSELR